MPCTGTIWTYLVPPALKDGKCRVRSGEAFGLHTILVVEDELEIRSVLVSVLSRPDYLVLSAANGTEAMALMAEHKVDLLVTDVKMPEINGFELAHQAKQLRPDLIVIYMSGFYTPAQKHSGPSGLVLAKPFRPSTLLVHVDKELGKVPPG
jgi:two-component system, cell cycle response regulator CpdR